MSVMSLSDVWPREDRPLTVDDLVRLPHDGNRYELVDGVLEVTPAPLNNHNRVMTRLSWLLGQQCPDDLEVLVGNGVNLARDLHRIPDIIVVRSEWIEPTDFIEDPPLLAIEVASNSTRRRDRTVKKREYQAFGIESYWIVEPDFDHPSLTAYQLTGSGYQQVASVADNEVFKAERPFPVTVMPRLLVEPGNAWRDGLA
jgi:Uma2 family endonuclease